jgi:hypothetical protein
MANEITIALSMSASKGGASINTVGATGPASASYNMTGADMISGTHATSTTTSAIPLGSVVAPYRIYMMNMEVSPSTTTISIDRATPVSGTPVTVLAPGDECFLVVPSGTTIYAIASSGTPSLFYAIVEK